MGSSHDVNEYLGAERHGLEDGEVVVHGAEIICKYGSGSIKPNYLLVLDGHGFMENGRHCAHDGNCIPMKNINPFEHCTSPDVKTALTALAPNAAGNFKERCDAALKVIETNKTVSEGAARLVPCALPLLNRWFDADEKEIVTESFEIGAKIVGGIEELTGKMKTSLVKAEAFNRNVYYNAMHVKSEYTLEERNKCLQISKDLEVIRGNIKD